MATSEERHDSDITTIGKTLKWFKYWSYLVVTLILLISSLYLYSKGFRDIFSDPQTFGIIGDFFGGVLTPIILFFALLTLFSIVSLQKKEIRYTIDALEASWQALQDQKETLDKQSFEHTFFALIDLYNKNTASLKLTIISERLHDALGSKPPNKKLSGLDVIDYISSVSRKRAVESSESQGVDLNKAMFKLELHKLINQVGSTFKLRLKILSSITQHLKSSKTASTLYLTILNSAVSVPEKYILFILLSDKGNSVDLRYLIKLGFFLELEDLYIGTANLMEVFKNT